MALGGSGDGGKSVVIHCSPAGAAPQPGGGDRPGGVARGKMVVGGWVMPSTDSRDHCPACGAALWAAPDEPVGAARCPRCGAELWVLAFAAGPTFFVRRPGRSLADLLADLAGPRLDLAAGDFARLLLRADELDLVELVLEVEGATRTHHG